jgi:hypothetical protein
LQAFFQASAAGSGSNSLNARRRRLYNPGAVGGSRLTQAIGGDKQIPTSNEDHLGLQFNKRV